MSTDKDLLQEWFDGDRATVQEAMARRCAEDPALAERVLAHDHCVAMLQGRLTSTATDPVIILDRLRRRRWHGRLRRTGLVLAAAAILAAIAAWWPKPAQPAVWGRLLTVNGSGLIEGRQEATGKIVERALIAGEPLRFDDRLVLEAGRVVLEDATATRLELRGGGRPASLQLQRPRAAGNCRLQRGELRITVPSAASQDRWTMATQELQLSTTNSRFTVVSDDGTTGIAVRAGQLSVQAPLASADRQLAAGESLVVRASATGQRPVALDHRPIGWWPGEADRENDDDLLDQSGNGGHGFLIFPQEATYVPGLDGDALRLSSRAQVMIEDHPRYDCGSGTIALWARPAYPWHEQAMAISKPISLLTKMDWDGAAGYELLHASGHPAEHWGGRVVLDRATRPSAVATMPPGTDWVHLAVTWGGGRLRFYQDGMLQSETPIPARPVPGNDQHITIGGNYAGLLDDIRLYDLALEPAEILALRLMHDGE